MSLYGSSRGRGMGVAYLVLVALHGVWRWWEVRTEPVDTLSCVTCKEAIFMLDRT